MKAALVTVLALFFYNSCSSHSIADIENPGCGLEPVEKVIDRWTAFCAAYAEIGSFLVYRHRSGPIKRLYWSAERQWGGGWRVVISNKDLFFKYEWVFEFGEDGNPIPLKWSSRGPK